MKGYNEITCMDTNYNKELEKMKKKKTKPFGDSVSVSTVSQFLGE